MKYLNLKKHVTLVVIVAFALSACKKVKLSEPMGDAGQTLVKILGGGTPAGIAKRPVDFVNIPTKLVGIDLRRDIPNNSELNKTMNVVVLDDTAAVTAANPAYVKLPIAWYTVEIDGVVSSPTAQGLNYNLNLKPGEFAKQIYITIPNATLLDPSLLYALGFTIISVDAGGKITEQKSVVMEVGAKNIYDGIYSVESGWVQRYTAPGVPEVGVLNGDLTGNPDVVMITVGAQAVTIPIPGVPGALFWAAASGSQVAGINGLVATVDPVTNLVTMTSAQNLTLINWAGHVNKWDPVSKTFTLAFRWNPVTTTREYEIVLKYKGPR